MYHIVSSDTFLIHWRLLRHFVYDNVGFVFARGTSVSVNVSIPYPKYIGNTNLNTDLIHILIHHPNTIQILFIIRTRYELATAQNTPPAYTILIQITILK